MPSSKTQPRLPTERLSVLVAEDNAVMQTLVRHLLRDWGYDAVVTADGARAWELLRNESAPRLALLDWMMPGIDGVELCRRIRAAGSEPYTYVLLVSGRTDSADMVKAMEAGADDYLRKPFVAEELRARLHAGSRIVRLHRELLAAREELRLQATRDSLTGALSHASILERLSEDVSFGVRANEPVAAILIDINRFRHINDSFGRPAGDEVLVEAARRLRAALPPESSIGRYGGGEFLVLLPRCSGPAAGVVAGRLREAITASAFNVGAASFPVSCCAGVACCEPHAPCDAATLLREVGESLFWAKREAGSQSTSAPVAGPATLVARAGVRP